MLSQKLREYRTKCGFSQLQVATELNIDRATYSYYESGRTQPSLENLKKISRMFDVHLYELLEISKPPERELICDTENDSAVDTDHFVGKLTEEERDLIMRFRLLNQADKSEVLDFIYPKDI